MLSELFKKTFGRSHEAHSVAPGRVNLIGEHTDYNDGFVFPAAIDFATQVLAAPRSDRIINMVAVDVESQRNRFSLDDIQFDNAMMWSNYARGVFNVLQEAGFTLSGMDLLITGNVPQGAGLSSSASFEVALLKVASDLCGLSLTGTQAAQLGQRAENEFVGCACGIMDQLICALGQQGRAMLLDCRSLVPQYTPISPEYQIVIINSNVKRGLVESEYNDRRAQCEGAARALGVNALRDATLVQLKHWKHKLTEMEYRRAKHVISENDRTLEFAEALTRGDYGQVSALMRASHQSMKNDFEITVPAIDYLVDLVHGILGDTGGVRMTGGGFGGCIVALCPTDKVDAVKRAVARHYQAETGLVADIYVCTAEDGAFAG
ncbi:galactokinase [Gilvimarinus sp. SDUM040013]|uniref:Galactokinase n=1 Tax=Gilvimarinus gilvus TaxID=3058038 RepID=A0ABU4S554_9GAMM|nr:galactokinase [Gilvimarinus sp. SDUM040013]MDO3384748.1 galactokinase [Gilvimarinus sp. SDUM040013]MDX6850434.1 galactokinase [Gilvimarinus sp. SDUM040013]